MTALDTALARKMHRTLEPYHGLVYFAPEPAAAYAELGIDDKRMGYFASRAAALGPVGPEVVIATFYNFSPDLVRRCIPAAWQRATPAELVDARRAGIDRALRRILGDAVDDGSVAEAEGLARLAADGCTIEGRPMYAGHRSLAWPDEPHVALWHAITLLREFRGDGHVACLVDQGVSGCEALVMHAAMGEVPAAVLQASRQRGDDEWAATVEALRSRGWLDAAGDLTEAGRGHRLDLEARTDSLAMAPWRSLGEPGCARLREIVRPMSRAIVESGAFR